MIVSFSLRNYRSFRERQTLNLHMERGDELPQNIARPDRDARIPILRTAAIYGANASGKSNLLRGLLTAISLMVNSHRFDRASGLPLHEPFLLDDDLANAPTDFELDFIIKGLHYRYAFSYTAHEITFEELAFYPSSKEAILFSRHRAQNADHLLLDAIEQLE
ncbi:MAG: ATP/GTP-binding protein [Oligosphaeraceae bacterium]